MTGHSLIRVHFSILFSVIEVLVQAKPESVNWKGCGEQTPLHYLCSEAGNIEMVKFLIDKEANVNAM